MAGSKSAGPVVSVIVPVFNDEPNLLRRSLDSLGSQSLRGFECLIVDESTESETIAACDEAVRRDPRFVHIRPSQRLGLAASLNLGLEKARGELVARFDADDICEADRLAKQVEFLRRWPAVGVVGSSLAIINVDGAVIHIRKYPTEHTQIAQRMQWANGFAHPTVMFRRELVAQHGPYRSEFRYCEDLELWLRWLRAGVRFANIREPLVKYRQPRLTRVAAHWRFNLRARAINFSLDRYTVSRVLGMAVVALFLAIPPRLQATIYRYLVLSSARGLTKDGSSGLA